MSSHLSEIGSSRGQPGGWCPGPFWAGPGRQKMGRKGLRQLPGGFQLAELLRGHLWPEQTTCGQWAVQSTQLAGHPHAQGTWTESYPRPRQDRPGSSAPRRALADRRGLSLPQLGNGHHRPPPSSPLPLPTSLFVRAPGGGAGRRRGQTETAFFKNESAL